jgi:hypothetical protein
MDKKEILKVLQKKTRKRLIIELVVYAAVYLLIMNFNWEEIDNISSVIKTIVRIINIFCLFSIVGNSIILVSRFILEKSD